MNTILIQLITAVIGAVAFAMMFNIAFKKLPFVAIGGFIDWACYLIILNLTNDTFVACFTASIAICIYSEIMARVLKAPANIFLIPSTVPLLPGATFYYTLNAMLKGNMNSFKSYGTETLLVVLGIAVGIVIGFFIFKQIIKFIKITAIF